MAQTKKLYLPTTCFSFKGVRNANVKFTELDDPITIQNVTYIPELSAKFAECKQA
jgi:hypothetical protein